ncbi:MAG: TRAM domain-containing protein [Halorientalis sp.]
MEIPDTLRCLFSTQVQERDGSYVLEVPRRELRLDTIDQNETYRIAVLPSASSDDDAESKTHTSQERELEEPPVEEGDTRRVEIEDLGEQGDGVTRVERGYVVIVPDTEQGERVAIEITDVRENVAFAEVTERLSYYD